MSETVERDPRVDPRPKTFEKRLQCLNRQMLVHACIGHPVASVLSLVGMRASAEYIHYRTLPKRARRKIPRWKITFDHSPELILADVFFNPLAHIARAFGRYRLCNWIFFSGPWETCLRHDTCNMTPDESRWAQDRYKQVTGKEFYGDEYREGDRASLKLRDLGQQVWSGQSRGIGPPDPDKKIDAPIAKTLFDRLTAGKFTRRGLRRIEDLIGVQITTKTSPSALRAVIQLLDSVKKKELEGLISRAESGDNLDAV